MSRPRLYSEHPELWALRQIVRYLSRLGQAERVWLMERLRADLVACTIAAAGRKGT